MIESTVALGGTRIHIVGHQQLIVGLTDKIRLSPTIDPSALPLRTKKGAKYPDWVVDQQIREANLEHYTRIKAAFVRNDLCLSKSTGAGIYFFIQRKSRSPGFYYIGITDSLFRRISDEHLRRKDFISYSLAYPEKRQLYLNEVLAFYGRKYSKYKCEYKLESECLVSTPFDTVAWISSRDLDMSTWEGIETHFVSFRSGYHPACNVKKVEYEPEQRFADAFVLVRELFDDLLSH